MTPITISYRIRFNEKHTEVFEFTLDGESGNLLGEAPASLPSWTALEYRQCSHCPLNKTEHPHCPVAVQLYNIIERFHNTSSIDEIELEVVTEERRISQTVPLQRAIGSMLGLVSPTCGCPKMAYMKPMARFHLPLSSEEETLFRVAGMYLLAQYVLNKTGAKGAEAGDIVEDFSGLKSIYEDLHILNKALATRLRGATESDSSKNAIALLDMYSNLVPLMIDDHLPQLKDLFSAYTGRALAVELPTVSTPVQESVITFEETVTPLPSVENTVVQEPVKAVEAPPVENKPVVEAISIEARVKEKTPEEQALEALMQEVPADELAELLGVQQDVVVKKNIEPQDRPKGRAVFQIADDPEPEVNQQEKVDTKVDPPMVQEKPRGRAVFKIADD